MSVQPDSEDDSDACPGSGASSKRILCLLGKHAYGDPARGIGVEYATFVPALQRLGHVVEVCDTHAKGVYASFADVNDAVLHSIESFCPDIILGVQFDVEVWTETLAEIRRRSTAILVNWTTDDTWKYGKLSRHIGRYYHGMATTYADIVPRYNQDGIRHVHVTQWAANSDWLQPPKSATACSYPVSFIGIAYGDRQRLVGRLHQQGIPVACFGHQWPGGAIPTEDIPRIMRDSVISLNFSKGLYGGPNQIKARTFEVPGAGGFLLTEDAPDLARWYDVGQEIDAWRDADELVGKIRFYLQRPEVRDAMAQRAHARTLREHLYEHRMADLVSFAAALPRDGQAPASAPYARVRAEHRSTPSLRTLHWCLRTACCCLWGKERSRRYARRLALEASLHLHGARTYSGRAWFGRMFPPTW